MSDKARRYNSNKVDYTLIPTAARKEEARAWMRGEIKYDRNNWKKLWGGETIIECMKSLLRHTTALEEGETIDPETGVSHAALIRCNAGMMIEHQSREGMLLSDDEFNKRLDEAREERRKKDAMTEEERAIDEEFLEAIERFEASEEAKLTTIKEEYEMEDAGKVIRANEREAGVSYYVRSDGMIEMVEETCTDLCKNCTCCDCI